MSRDRKRGFALNCLQWARHWAEGQDKRMGESGEGPALLKLCDPRPVQFSRPTLSPL